MRNCNILFLISGSIAAYKSAEAISKFSQLGYTVQVVTTDSALNFIGAATLEGLSGKPVMSNIFENGKMMSHIDLVKWADVMVLAPATATTINSMNSGLGQNLVSSLFLAHDWEKPYFIAPAMNTKMWSHPATVKSMEQLKKWGLMVLEPEEGALACGDYGSGRMMEPNKIVDIVNKFINHKNNLSILITAGGTKEPIDGARCITNISTGRTAASIANVFIKHKWDVTFLSSHDSKLPSGTFKHIRFTNIYDLEEKLNTLISENKFNALIHNAAVSDYVPINVDLNKKINSSEDKIFLEMKRSPKLIDSLLSKSKNRNIQLVAFKLTVNLDDTQKKKKVDQLIAHSNADLVVQNDISDRFENEQTHFNVYDKNGNISNFQYSTELGEALQEKIVKELQ
jgi:phosphopantothenoylcysteine decarboxylase/phosphopantothenate--cysteine ligase|tara:strand:+ start:11251 stop:12444 length:1194 start_codon:yes stop_codon:yes gene_type:complete